MRKIWILLALVGLGFADQSIYYRELVNWDRGYELLELNYWANKTVKQLEKKVGKDCAKKVEILNKIVLAPLDQFDKDPDLKNIPFAKELIMIERQNQREGKKLRTDMYRDRMWSTLGQPCSQEFFKITIVD